MCFNRELDDLSRGQLYDVINGLKEENSCLKTDLIKYKYISNQYQKYFEFFIQINETIASNEKVMDLVKDIKLFNSLTEKNCFVALKRLSDNHINETRVQRVDESVEQNSSETQETIESQEIEGQNRINEREENSEEKPEQKVVKIEIKIEDFKQEVKTENQIKFEDKKFLKIESMIETQPKSDETIVTSIHSNNNSELNIPDIEIIEEIPNHLNQLSYQQIVKNETQMKDNSKEIPERNPIEIITEDIAEENNRTTDSMIETLNIEEIEDISINLNTISQINVNSETNILDIEFNRKTGHQMNESLNHTIVKTETQREDNSEEVTNESQNTIDAIKECKPEEECIEFIDITENDSELEQVIDGCDEELKKLNETHHKINNRLITSEYPFVWDIGSATLKNQNSLKKKKNRRRKRCSIIKYRCKVGGCYYRGSQLCDLNNHSKAVHGITDLMIGQLEDNNSNFEQMSGNRFITQIQHNIERVFSCEVCSAVFNTRRLLLKHKNRHTNKFACAWPDCTFRGSNANDLGRHQTRKHLNITTINYNHSSVRPTLS